MSKTLQKENLKPNLAVAVQRDRLEMLLREALVAFGVALQFREEEKATRSNLRNIVGQIDKLNKEHGLDKQTILNRGYMLYVEVVQLAEKGLIKYHTQHGGLNEKFWVWPLEKQSMEYHKVVIMNDLFCFGLDLVRPCGWLVGVARDQHLDPKMSIKEFRSHEPFINLIMAYELGEQDPNGLW